MKTRLAVIVGSGLGLLLLAAVLATFQVCRDCAFIDQNTGSRQGYREWFFGWRGGTWYQESTLETFMRAKQPGIFQQDWHSYAGTGRNIFGKSVSWGHGRPGPIMLLKTEVINEHCKGLSEMEMRQLYDVLSGADTAKIRELADRIVTTQPNTNGFER